MNETPEEARERIRLEEARLQLLREEQDAREALAEARRLAAQALADQRRRDEEEAERRRREADS